MIFADALLASTDPGVRGPQELVALVKWCWVHRDADRYRELFTDDFHFTYVVDASETGWDRNQEVDAAARLFGPGTASQPGATTISLAFEGAWNPGSLHLTERPYPWHQQVSVPNVWFEMVRSDGSIITAHGTTLFYLVRGDSAVIPQELLDRGFTRDSTRWYVERWEDTPLSVTVVDHAPVVTAPAAVDRNVNVSLTFPVTVTDPDGHAIESLYAEGASGMDFQVAANKSSGVLNWTPTTADAGTRTVTFVATNALRSATRTVFTITGPNQRPTAALAATPTQGAEPLLVRLDASGSFDVGGRIDSYRFNFGDGAGTTSANPVVSHTYLAGAWRATVTVTDNAADTASAGVNLVVTGPVNRPPTAALVASPTQGTAPLLVVLDARGSSDPDGNLVRYRFDFGDGVDTTSSNPVVSHIYQAGAWRATVTVVDAAAATATAGVDLLVTANRPPTAALAASPTQGAEPLLVALDARGSADPDGNLVSYRFDFGDGRATTSSNPVVSHTYWAGSWRATVTVTDGLGAAAAAGVDLTVSATANLAKNASFEVDAGGWITEGQAAVARIAGGHEGQYALQVTGAAAMQNHFGINDSPNMVSQATGAGVRLRFTAWVRSPSALGTAKLLIREYSNSTGARLGEVFSVPARLSPNGRC